MNVRARLFLLFAIPGCGRVVDAVVEHDAATASSVPADASATGADDAAKNPGGDATTPLLNDGGSPVTPDGACPATPGSGPREQCLDDAGMRALFTLPDGAVTIPDAAYDENGCVVATHVRDDCCNPPVAGPVVRGATCCYAFCPGACCGRPFVIDGSARTASLARTRDWSGRVEARAPQDDALRRMLARAFAEDALMEHASIASFARFTLELLSFNAPHSLVLDAQQAALDEVEHARIVFALASRFSESPLGPGPLDVRGVVPAASLEDAVVAAVREGCVEETLAAIVAEERARVAQDSECRTALRRIASDEARHAELAWRFVAWAVSQVPTLGPAVERAFEETLATLSIVAPHECEDARTARYGVVSAQRRISIVADAVKNVIEPCMRRLVAGFTDPANKHPSAAVS